MLFDSLLIFLFHLLQVLQVPLQTEAQTSPFVCLFVLTPHTRTEDAELHVLYKGFPHKVKAVTAAIQLSICHLSTTHHCILFN